MEKKTHIAAANFAALTIVRPTTLPKLLLTVGVASLAGILSDVDLKDSASDKLFDKLMVSLITIVCFSLGLKYIFDVDIYSMIEKYNKYFSYFISLSIFTVLAYLGSKTPHRSFTHSLFACFIFTAILSYGFGLDVLVPFIVAYLSHILLDCLNMRGVSIFYPFKKKVCLKLCDSSGKINSFLFYLFLFNNIIILSILAICSL